MHPPPSPHSHAATLERLNRWARRLDTSIELPGGLRIGWDAVLGLLPGVGDWTGALLSSYIVIQAARLGASRAVLLRMIGNVALDSVLGAVPVVGDFFDAAWRANTRNMKLLEQHLAAPDAARRASGLWLLGIILLLVVLPTVGLSVALVYLFVRLTASHS